MSGKQTRFFLITVLCSIAFGAVLGAAFSFGDKGSRDAAEAERGASGIGAAVIDPAGPARPAFQNPARLKTPAAAARQEAEPALDAAPPLFAAEKAASARLAPQENGSAFPAGSAGESKAAANAAEQAEQNAAALPAEPRGVLNGYKGYRYHRPGYKSGGDGWWYPRAAFAKKTAARNFFQKPSRTPKAAAAEKVKRPPHKAEGKKRDKKPQEHKDPAAKAASARQHRAWCAAHHPSYNPDDNSYRQGFGGKRRCVSPYSRK